MTEQPELSVLLQFVPVITLSVALGLTAYLLAKEKGRNVGLWTLLGCLPVINFFCLWFFVGAANLRLERKIDGLLAQHSGRTTATSSD